MFYQYKEKTYPYYLKDGHHSQYISPIANKFCGGKGIDIGFAKEEWKFEKATDFCDLLLDAPWNDCLNIPVGDGTYDFVFSSHCLEHIENYLDALEEWKRILKKNGIIFLYLPSLKCEYWHTDNCKKHKHNFEPKTIAEDLQSLGFTDVLYSGVDLAYSYSIVGVKS